MGGFTTTLFPDLPGLGPCLFQIWGYTADQACQLDFPCVFIFPFPCSRWSSLNYASPRRAQRWWPSGLVSMAPGSGGVDIPLSPPPLPPPQKRGKSKKGWVIVVVFFWHIASWKSCTFVFCALLLDWALVVLLCVFLRECGTVDVWASEGVTGYLSLPLVLWPVFFCTVQ